MKNIPKLKNVYTTDETYIRYYYFFILGNDEGVWHMDLKNAPGSSGVGEPKATTDVTFSLKDTDFHKMFEGKQNYLVIARTR